MEDHIELQQTFTHIDTRYRFTYHEFANLLEIEVLIDLPWWKSMWRTDGQERIWKRMYFGHSTPIEKAVELFKRGQEAENPALSKGDVTCRNSVRWFAEKMEAKLAKNDHKGGWGSCELQYLSMRLTQERKELTEAIKSKDKQRIIDECADIANFALMIADKFGENYGG